MSRKSDLGHQLTDKELAKLETKIAAEYKKAADEMAGKVSAYFEAFEVRDAAMAAKVEAGEITEAYYTQWRLNQIGRGERMDDLKTKLASRMTDAREVAFAYVNDATPGIYSINRNYAAYIIERATGNVGFTMWDESTVKRLIATAPDLMPNYPLKKGVARGIDISFGKRQITAQVTTGILQGESTQKIANRLVENIPGMDARSAIRAARTAVTSAQNAGRQDSYEAAAKMGIKMMKKWVSTLDSRTREEHRGADGQTAEVNDPFIVGGEELMYPGDTAGSAWNVYNCRCTTVTVIEGVDTSDTVRWARDPETGEKELVGNLTYKEWMASKNES